MIAPLSALREFVERALAEDIGRGDATTDALFAKAVLAEGRIAAKASTVMAGGPVAALVFQTLDPTIWTTVDTEDGQSVEAGTTLLTVRGDGRSILTGERVALNILQRLCGIAALTRQFVDAVRGYACRITDTRKTPAGWRMLDKYAVRCGGGSNHRFGLDDGILIKDTHLALSGGIAESVRQARAHAGHLVKVEIEVSTVSGAREALEAGADAILLDNMSLDDIRAAVASVKSRAVIEVSGGVTLATVRDIAALGVDCISVGALTHSAPAADLHLELWRT
ncbi:MAG: carboxylating nicotinate-nucleotide diphosphorylase [Nitrospirota bacterium]